MCQERLDEWNGEIERWTLKPHLGSRRTTLPGKGWSTTRKLTSVKPVRAKRSEAKRVSRLRLSAPKCAQSRAHTVELVEGHAATCVSDQWGAGRRGVSPEHAYEDPPATWEILLSPPRATAPGVAETHSRAAETTRPQQRIRGEWYRRASQTSRRDGQQEVGVAHSTREGGEHAPVDPLEERGHQSSEPLEG